MKKAQSIMIWFLPVILIGGVFYPLIGYMVVIMVAFFLTLSFFKGRYWCWYLCPRGSFLDIALSKMSLNRPFPRILTKEWFRWLVFVLLMGFLVFRLFQTGGNLLAIGFVFIGMCILTTIIAVPLGILTKHRGWCMICPMGNLQEKIGKLSQNKAQKSCNKPQTTA